MQNNEVLNISTLDVTRNGHSLWSETRQACIHVDKITITSLYGKIISHYQAVLVCGCLKTPCISIESLDAYGIIAAYGLKH